MLTAVLITSCTLRGSWLQQTALRSTKPAEWAALMQQLASSSDGKQEKSSRPRQGQSSSCGKLLQALVLQVLVCFVLLQMLMRCSR